MTNRAIAFSVLLLAWSGVLRGVPAPVTLRVLTYNIHHGEGTDGLFDLVRIADVVKRAQPDLVALQEVDQGTERASAVNQLAELERLTGMFGKFGRAMEYLGGDYGVAVLSRWPIESARNRALPGAPDREPRTALTVRVKAGDAGPWVQFTSTHFDQGRDEQNRLAQAASLNDLEIDADQPAILAGDFNSRPDTEVIKTLDARWMNAFQADPSPASDGRPRRGDYVLFRPVDRWRVIATSVIDERIASDHRPVLAVLEWTGELR